MTATIKTEKLTDYPPDEQIKLMYAQQDPKDYQERQERQRKEERRYKLYTYLGIGALIVLGASAYFDNSEVPKVAGTVLLTILAYAAGRDASG